jgi:Family of unknown function (DUF6488)
MRYLTVIIAAILVGVAPINAWADKGDSCHFHGSKPAAETIVIGCADARRDTLVKSGKLHASWSTVKHEKLEQIDGKKGREWKVSYKNAAAPDKEKQSLFMFFTLPGNFLAANHSGQ